ncbi:hypothetical protein [Actinokineospora diospyrosa]|uniref:Fusaric acid resistance family protein n=1 Tax=Actinokineospora diospyrosa TaxID=103728 RepID=A0ABT1IF21_9PSEU|nr:hypothetical protein [Actinokineospora diospyrosa]MCP2271239.1 hypothetical protein [Actinokineospora diospyrosa]
MLRRNLVRSYRLAVTALSALVVFTGVCAGVSVLRTWTLVFLAVTAICLSLALSAALTGNSNLRGVVLSAMMFAALVATAGLVVLVEWVAFALVGALLVAAIPLRGGRGQSTAYLCARWHDTLIALRHATNPDQAVTLLRTRQRYLDELERRHPEAFHRWLSTPDVDPASILAPRQNSL